MEQRGGVRRVAARGEGGDSRSAGGSDRQDKTYHPVHVIGSQPCGPAADGGDAVGSLARPRSHCPSVQARDAREGNPICALAPGDASSGARAVRAGASGHEGDGRVGRVRHACKCAMMYAAVRVCGPCWGGASRVICAGVWVRVVCAGVWGVRRHTSGALVWRPAWAWAGAAYGDGQTASPPPDPPTPPHPPRAAPPAVGHRLGQPRQWRAAGGQVVQLLLHHRRPVQYIYIYTHTHMYVYTHTRTRTQHTHTCVCMYI